MLPVFFSVGFRPFFSSAILFGSIAALIWGLFWLPETPDWVFQHLAPIGGFLFWHAHEMLFGFTQAIILGFLLTAARNWTGIETASPHMLILLLSFWLQARFIMFIGASLEPSYIVISQIVTPLIGALCIGIPILKKRMWRNLFAPIALVVFALLDATAVLQIHQGHFPHQALHACLLLIIFIITIIGGRIIPLFTANKLGLKKTPEPTLLTALSSLPVLVLIWLEFMPSDDKVNHIQSALAFVLFIAHGIRLFRWHDAGIWKEPMLWSLFVFYSALPVGFLFRALDLHIDIASTHLHMLAVGTICGLIISMVSRVSLGHTGRKITHDSLIVSAFFLLISAFILRTFGVMMFGSDAGLISSSALLASLSFLLIFVRFISVWLTPRADQ